MANSGKTGEAGKARATSSKAKKIAEPKGESDEIEERWHGTTNTSYRTPSVEVEYPKGAGGPKSPSKAKGQAVKVARKARKAGAEYGAKAKDIASKRAVKATAKVEASKDQAATWIERAADLVRGRTEPMGGLRGAAGSRVAQTMEGASRFLRDHTAADLRSGVTGYVRGHPARSFWGALVTGFAIGRLQR